MSVSRVQTKLKISHVSLLHKKFNLNTLNVGVALFHNNNNSNVALAVVAVVPVVETTVAALVTAAVAVLNRF